jgi:hypothetical protein
VKNAGCSRSYFSELESDGMMKVIIYYDILVADLEVQWDDSG